MEEELDNSCDTCFADLTSPCAYCQECDQFLTNCENCLAQHKNRCYIFIQPQFSEVHCEE